MNLKYPEAFCRSFILFNLGGPDSRLDDVLEHWTLYNEELASFGLEISRLTLDPRGAWEMQLTSGTEIKLGRQDVLPRLQRLMQSWDELLVDRPAPPAIATTTI